MPDVQVTVLLAFCGLLLSIAFVLKQLRSRGSPAATLSWILFILAAPWIGLAFYHLFPRRIQTRRLRRRRKRTAWIESTLDHIVLPAPRTEVRLRDPLARLITRLDPDALSCGNRVRLLESGLDFFGAAIEAIANARKFVHLQSYIFRPDRAGNAMLGVLGAAAARGVEVRLLYDAFGSWGLRRRHLAGLHRAGGRSAPAMPLLWRRRPFNLNLRNHRKVLVVDGRIGFVGGRNIGDEYVLDRFGKEHRWLDTMFAVEGPALPRLHRSFVEDWYNATEEDLAHRRYFPPAEPAGEDDVAVVTSGPDQLETPLHWIYLELISSSRDTLDITSPYLVPHPTVLTALLVAAARGVRVRIHTNSAKAESRVLYAAQRTYYEDLLRVGVEIWEPRADYNHGKMIIVDRKYCFVGSANLDVRSIELNFEIGVVTFATGLLDDAIAVFERRLHEGVRIQVSDLPRSFVVRSFDGFCRLMSPLL